MTYEIVSSGEREVEEVHAGLRRYNRGFCPDVADLSCCIKDGEGRCIAGTDSFRMGEMASVDVLWVDEGHRGQGLGSALLAHVEAQARAQGARRLELNTLGFQAPGFYEKLGYRRFGAIEPAVGDYGHYFYVKDLT
ncbi:GNAT family N-acetyltransferase [Intestinimonas timonensis]|uniref:GNAT family N-acetyltransferase n=1 Tax=Intestinimonas timonensis TaxID=1689270 RepID=UPI003A948F5B